MADKNQLSREDVQEMVETMGQTMIDFMDTMRPIEEAARGYKAELERNGWSPAMAEQVAGMWLMAMQQKAMGL